jgi:hypothetical protein
MNKKIMLVAVTVFLLAMLATPVMAEPAEKISFSATQIPSRPPPPQGDDYRMWDTAGNTHHVRNRIGAGAITLEIEGKEPISGTTSSIFDSNTRTGEGGYLKFLMIWTFDDGTFVGNIIGKLTSPTTIEDMHGVLQGRDTYEGWTVLLNGFLSTGPFQWTGTIVMPQ